MDWGKALEIASGISHPYSAAAFAAVLAAMALLYALRVKKPRIAGFLVPVILVLGLSPLIASTFLASRGIYHIRIVVEGIDGQPTEDADLSSSTGGELKKANGNWEFDLPPQAKPTDGKVTFFASVKDAYLSGSSTLVLGEDYFPTLTIKLTSSPSATIRGDVTDENGKSVVGARVSVVGYPDVAITDEMGNFSLSAHHPEGQLVSVRAEKGGLVANISTIAGKDAEIVLRKR